MATFSRATFNAVSYAAFRPTYPRALFEHIFRFHGASGDQAPRWDMAVDLGCGTGQATVELTPFKNVVGVDPSARMIDVARRALSELTSRAKSEAQGAPGARPESHPNALADTRITYVQSEAEELTFLPDASVDLMISAQAGHWFNWQRIWREAARVLRAKGTFATWIYSEPRLPKYPTLTPQMVHFMQGTDLQTSIGSYWQQPGRSILVGHLVTVPDANSVVPGAFENFTRCYFTGDYYPDLPSPRPIIMRKHMTWNNLYSYFRTSSALHTFLEQNPEDKERIDGDVAQRFWKSLLSDASAQDGVAVQPEDEIEVDWPLALLLVKRA